MLAAFRSREATELVAITGGFFKSQYQYSKISASAGAGNAYLMVDYLIDSLGFSRNEAISAASKSKVTHLKSTNNCNSVVKLFKDYGFDDSQIRKMVSCYPRVLLCKPNKTLEPKIRYFQELKLPGSDFVKLVKKNPSIFMRRIDTQIIPAVEYLRKLLGSEEKVIQVVTEAKYLFCSYAGFLERISAIVSLLQKYGLSNEIIFKGILRNINTLLPGPEELQDKLHYVETKLGIPRDSPNFIYGVNVSLWFNESNIEKKMQVYKSFGFSDSELSKLIATQPFCLTKSEANTRAKLEFFMKELGLTTLFLATRVNWSWSLEKRVKPRCRILKKLKDMKLVDHKPSFTTVLTYSELRFHSFLQRFEGDLPGICESYVNDVKGASTAE